MNVIVSPKHRSLVVPYHEGFAGLVPGRELIHPKHGRCWVVPHTRDTTKLARNFGFATPAPILSQYDWNGDTPFHTQMITAALCTMQPRAFVLNEMGTGKTRAVLHALNYLIQTGEIRRVLVLAPLSTLHTVWANEVMRYFNHLSVGVLHARSGGKQARLKVLAQDHHIYVINHDGLETVLAELVARADIDCVVVDELATYRNKRTARWKAAESVVANRAYAWGLTGSPTPNEPADAWAQVKLLLPARVPKFFNAFKSQVMNKITQFRWIARPEANQIVFDAMQPAVRFKRDDCIELPDTIYQDVKVAMSTEQARVYKEMMTKLKLAFQQGVVTAVNEGVLLSKLLQIASGFVYTTDKKVVSLDNQPRFDALVDQIQAAEGKVIVFVSFVHAANVLHQQLNQLKIPAALITGDVPAHIRNQVFHNFQNSALPRVLVAHPRTMAHGLTLTEASVIIWYTPAQGLDTYQQACARITRPGQRRTTYIVHLTASPAESKICRRLQQNASLQGALLEMFEAQDEE